MVFYKSCHRTRYNKNKDGFMSSQPTFHSNFLVQDVGFQNLKNQNELFTVNS